MIINWRKVCTFALAVMLFLLPSSIASSGQTILTQAEYDEKYQVYLQTNVATPELISTWEYYSPLYPEDNQLRYFLVRAYLNSGQYDKAKACAKEALQYEPDSTYFAYMYLILCYVGGDLNEIQPAAEYLLELTLPLIPPVGQLVNQNDWDNNYYNYLEDYLNAVELLQEVYIECGDEEKILQYSDWILQRKDDSDLGYEFGLLSMFRLAVYYGNSDRFSEMEYWIDEYFTFEATAEIKGGNWAQKQEFLQMFTDVLQEIDSAYQEQGDEIDIDAIIEAYPSQ